MYRWIRFVAVAAFVFASVACGSSRPPRGIPASPVSGVAVDPAIRSVDFASAVFQPNGVAATPVEPVQFQGGTGKARSGYPYPQTYTVTAGPIYADADADGDEDAAIQIGSDGGGTNGIYSAWWVWLWEGERARQVLNQFGEASRCGGSPGLVSAAPDGFAVNDTLWPPDASCIAGTSTPQSYTIGVRSGFVVRVRPALAAPDSCDPRRFDEATAPPAGTVLRAARDERAPAAVVVADGHRILRSAISRRYGDPADPWVLVLHDDGRQRICAWAPSASLAPPR